LSIAILPGRASVYTLGPNRKGLPLAVPGLAGQPVVLTEYVKSITGAFASPRFFLRVTSKYLEPGFKLSKPAPPFN